MSTGAASLNLLVGIGLSTLTFLNHFFIKNKNYAQKKLNRCPLVAPVSRYRMSWIIGTSVYIWWEITPLRAFYEVRRAIDVAVYDCVWKVLHDGDAARSISPVLGGLSGGEIVYYCGSGCTAHAWNNTGAIKPFCCGKTSENERQRQ